MQSVGGVSDIVLFCSEMIEGFGQQSREVVVSWVDRKLFAISSRMP